MPKTVLFDGANNAAVFQALRKAANQRLIRFPFVFLDANVFRTVHCVLISQQVQMDMINFLPSFPADVHVNLVSV